MGNAIGISPFLVIASLLIGGAVGGLAGALVAIPVAAAVEVVLEHIQARDHAVTPTTEVVPDENADADGAIDAELQAGDAAS